MESLFNSKEEFLAMRDVWKKVTNSEDRTELELIHFCLYAILRNKDWRKCLSPNSKDETIADIEWKLFKSDYVSLWPFGGLDKEIIGAIRQKGLKRWNEV